MTLSAAHNIIYNYSNSPTNVYPSAYTTNTQFQFTQPLLGSSPNSFNNNPTPAGLEANRAPIVVQRLQADISVWRFKAEVQAMVRSIEQQYWALSQAQVQYWASETAVDLGEQILKREEAKYAVGQSALPNVAEAAEQLERFKLDFVDKTANLITTERQLRNILGLPPTDNRRIVPVHGPHRGPPGTELGGEPRPDDHVPARHRPEPAPGPRGRASAPDRPQPALAGLEPERPVPAQRARPPPRPVGNR